jgi:signal transduction histidine kinase
MWVGFGGIEGLGCRGLAEAGGLVIIAGALWCRMQAKEAIAQKKLRVAEEFAAYAGLKLGHPQDGGMEEVGLRVCEVVAKKSVFYRTAMLVRDAQDDLSVVASKGMEGLFPKALNAWGRHVREIELQGVVGAHRGAGDLGVRVGRDSFAVVLDEGRDRVGCGRAIVVPLRTAAGRMVGALAVGADAMLSVPQRMIAEAVAPLEALAERLGRAMEDAALAERLLRAEKLAGLGMLAGGMAHALNNPLTAVLGFAELIAEATDEARVKSDAGMIVGEALRMRKTVDALLEFWRPTGQLDERVDVAELMRELAESCRGTLVGRGVKLVVQAGVDAPVVRGSRDRLRKVMEHLLNNAAQAVAALQGSEEHAIRLTVSRDDRIVHLVVSDTGPGFREPARAFDPFFPTRQAGKGVGLGLSICYGIVHEHGGEISAYNVPPHGAAVVVELPVAEKVVVEKDGGVVEGACFVVND